MCDEVYVNVVKKDLEELMLTYSELFDEAVIDKLTMHLQPDDVFKTQDMSNVEFEPKTDDDRRSFSEKINANLKILGIRRQGNLMRRRDLLRQHFEAIHRKKKLEEVLTKFNGEGAMILLEMAIPCILHMENRVGEKILKLLLIAGFNERDSDPRAQKELLEKWRILLTALF